MAREPRYSPRGWRVFRMDEIEIRVSGWNNETIGWVRPAGTVDGDVSRYSAETATELREFTTQAEAVAWLQTFLGERPPELPTG